MSFDRYISFSTSETIADQQEINCYTFYKSITVGFCDDAVLSITNSKDKYDPLNDNQLLIINGKNLEKKLIYTQTINNFFFDNYSLYISQSKNKFSWLSPIEELTSGFISSLTFNGQTIGQIVTRDLKKFPTQQSDEFLYLLGGGGDESKLPWFIKISDNPIQNYMNPDGISANNNFYNETLLGKMIPFTILGYAHHQTGQQYENWNPGTFQITAKNIKYNSENDPLQLVYSSSSFTDNDPGHMDAVLVYKINKNYSPQIYPIQK